MLQDLIRPEPSTLPRPPGITCLSFKRVRSGGLVGFANLHIPAMRIKLFACPVQQSNGKRWVGVPSKPQLDRDRQLVRGENDKPLYSQVVAWDSTEVRNRFSDAAVAAVLAYDPGAFDQEG